MKGTLARIGVRERIWADAVMSMNSPASTLACHPDVWPPRSVKDVLFETHLSMNMNRVSQKRVVKQERKHTSGSESSTSVLRSSMACHTPMRARVVFLKFSRALRLNATVCFSVKEGRKVSS